MVRGCNYVPDSLTICIRLRAQAEKNRWSNVHGGVVKHAKFDNFVAVLYVIDNISCFRIIFAIKCFFSDGLYGFNGDGYIIVGFL